MKTFCWGRLWFNSCKYSFFIRTQIFGGNVDSIHTRTVYFDDVIKARFIRLIPITFVSYPTLRMEILTPTDLLNREMMASIPAKAVCTFGNALLHIDE